MDYEAEKAAIEAAYHAQTKPLRDQLQMLYDQEKQDLRALFFQHNIQNPVVELIRQGHRVTKNLNVWDDDIHYKLDGKFNANLQEAIYEAQYLGLVIAEEVDSLTILYRLAPDVEAAP